MKLRKRPDGRWTTQVKTAKGKYKSVYGKTKRECEEKAKRLLVEVETGNYSEKSKTTVSGWWDRWLEVCSPRVRESTVLAYRERMRNWVLPEFGDVRIGDIGPEELQEWVNKMSGEISPDTVKGVWRTFHTVMEDAVRLGVLKSNPVAGADLPKKAERRMSVLDSTEFSAFLEAAERTGDYRGVFEFLLLTGIRVGECLGMTVGQYDKAKGSVLVDRQYNINTRKTTGTKSGRSREVFLCGRAKRILEEKIEGKGGGDLVFDKGGGVIPYQTLYKHFKRAAAEFGRPELRIHDLRHSFATAALKSGVDVKTLQETLGHSSAVMTLDLYSHASEEMKKAATEKLDGLFGN